MKKVVNLSEVKFLKMSEDQLLAHVIDQLVTQTNQLVLLNSDLSRRLSAVEDAVSSFSTPALFDGEEK